LFQLSKPTSEEIQAKAAAIQLQPPSLVDYGTLNGPKAVSPLRDFVIAHRRSQIGYGLRDFERAKNAFHQWKIFDLGWVSVADPQLLIEKDAIVAVVVNSLGLWSVNYSRIVHVIDESTRFGFVYRTTESHIERGEERFLLEVDPSSNAVYYDLLAISKPAHFLSRLGFPFTRHFQKRFAIDSHRAMKSAIKSAS
jgi:uncharacterized protein (UPF0548 family)